MDTKRWMWLEVHVKSPGMMTPAIKNFYVPEAIVDHIPSYKAQLLKKPASINSWVEHTIRDTPTYPRDQETFLGAIRFLVNGFLVPLNTTSTTCDNALGNLVDLYKLGIALSIKFLETALVNHIDELDFEALPHQKFLGFARSYYHSSGVDAQRSSLGLLIKKKLFTLLPYLQRSMTIEEISSENGTLGKQLIAVLLEDRVMNQATAAAAAASGPEANIKMER
jgi:hypothetical protein